MLSLKLRRKLPLRLLQCGRTNLARRWRLARSRQWRSRMRRPVSWCRDPGGLSSSAMSTTRLAQCIPCLVGHASTVQRQLPPTGDVRSSLTRMGAAGIGVRSSGSRTRVVRGSLLADACAGGGRRMTGVGTELATTCGSQHWLRATELPRSLFFIIIQFGRASGCMSHCVHFCQ